MGEKSRGNFHLSNNMDEKRWAEIFGKVEQQMDEDEKIVLAQINKRVAPKKRYKSIDEFWGDLT